MGLVGFIKKKWNDWYYHDIDSDDDSDEIAWDDINENDERFFQDNESRKAYVIETLERMAEAAEKTEETRAEFDAVTSLLIDMEEIESLPGSAMDKIKDIATKIQQLEQQRRKIFSNTDALSESTVAMIERLEEEIPSGIEKMREAEQYRRLVKSDLKKLDGERMASRIRKRELKAIIGNSRGIAMICGVAMLMCFVVLMYLHFGLGMNVGIGYLIAGGSGAVAMTYIYVRYIDATRELSILAKTINKLINLHNTVKIRYINNTNLLSYLYMKYDVDDSSELEEIWNTYIDELGARRKDEQLRLDLDYYYEQLTRELKRNNIKDPDIWTHQAVALYDQRERVEVRHALIARRQKLREQMEYNEKVARDEQAKIKALGKRYPQYSQEIAKLVSEYQGL